MDKYACVENVIFIRRPLSTDQPISKIIGLYKIIAKQQNLNVRNAKHLNIIAAYLDESLNWN